MILGEEKGLMDDDKVPEFTEEVEEMFRGLL